MSSFQRDVGLIVSHKSILFTLYEANFLNELCYITRRIYHLD